MEHGVSVSQLGEKLVKLGVQLLQILSLLECHQIPPLTLLEATHGSHKEGTL